jgi:2-iminobutanoate/2-iminopropanoate deaminase
VRVGDLLFVSGQAGTEPSTGKPAGETFGEQARQVFSNLEAVLRAGGSNPTLVVNTTVLVADVGSFPELNELFGEFFSMNPPARMTMQVPLPQDLLILIGCVAATRRDVGCGQWSRGKALAFVSGLDALTEVARLPHRLRAAAARERQACVLPPSWHARIRRDARTGRVFCAPAERAA